MGINDILCSVNPDEVSRVYYADSRIHIRKNRIGLCLDEGRRLQATDMDHLHRLPPPLASFAASWSLPWQPQEADGVATAEELKQALLRTTLELESTRATAKEELRRMESRALHFSRLLEAVTRERDEARHALLLLLLHHTARGQPLQEPKPNLGPNLALDEGTDVAEAAAAAAATAAAEDVVERSNRASSAVAEVELAAVRRALPEKGRLVEAVMGAGPLLLLGPIHMSLDNWWRHPPPDLRSSEIPPEAISLNSIPKREKDGAGSPSPSSFWNSSSSSSPESGSHRSVGGEVQNVTFS
ncbi:unnamed protein product [Musa acuminata subsp. malaccensis]|uniref:(wild Malaysian banana) hypothetical protein n=1 Tax=Musa acuminata subsp. malaccensis TaxID=214687 RepID=A0A804J3X3_MUSAM|nr:unnamed protein product [Musa acuminata subsp. malaccensis]